MAHKIIEILSIEGWTRNGKTHYKTYALLDNQEEAAGYGKDYKVGDEVMSWFDDDWDEYKMKK